MLRHSYNTEAEIPAEFKSHYKQGDDGKFYLQVDGMVPRARVDEFRDNNTELKRQLAEAKAAIEGIDLKRAKELLDLDRAGKIKTGDAANQDVEAQVQQRTQTMKEDCERRLQQAKEDHDKKLAEMKKTQDTMATQLERVMIDDAVAVAFVKKGGLPNAVGTVKLLARDTFKLVDGKIVAYGPDGKEIYGANGLGSLSVEEYVEKMVADKDSSYLFKANQGSGAEGSRSNGRPVEVKGNPFKSGNLTEQGRLLRDNPAEYNRLKQEAEAA